MDKAGFLTRSSQVGRTIVLALVAAAPFMAPAAWALAVTATWNPSPDPTVVGYNLYYGGASQTYTNMIAVGNITSAVVAGLVPGSQCFFAATAVNGAGLESVFSNEVAYQVPGAPPVPVAPPVTWPSLANIVYGTALGAAQLDASCSVPGSFSYNPPAGTVLNAGRQVLWVTFNPTDTSSYVPVTISGSLTILPAATLALVTSSANPSLTGAAVTFTAALSAVPPGAGVPTGTVQFIIDGAVAGGPAPLTGAAASYTTSALGSGAHTVAAQYAGDGNFTGTTNLQASAQVVNTAPVSGAYTAVYDPVTGAKLPLAALLSAASPGGGNSVTLASMAASSANGGTVSRRNGWIFYLPPHGFTNADSFSYVITEGGTQVPGTVTLTPGCDDGSSANLSIGIEGDGSYAISGSGVPGRLYQLQFTDGAGWQLLGQVLADPNGCFAFIDPSGSAGRHYRSLCL